VAFTFDLLTLDSDNIWQIMQETQFLASRTSPLHRPWQKFGMEETSVQRGFNIATTIHNTGTNCTAHMQLATRKLLSPGEPAPER